MDVSGRTTQEIKSSSCRGANTCPYVPGHIRTAIPGSLRYTVHPVHKKADTFRYLLNGVTTGLLEPPRYRRLLLIVKQ